MTDLEKQVSKIRDLQSQLRQAIAHRDQLIADQIEDGKTLREVAALARLSFPRVQQIVSKNVQQPKSL